MRSTTARHDPPGQILVVFAAGLVLLFMVAGLVIDGGTAFLNRRDGQNAADIAAMAGTKRLADQQRGVIGPSVYDTIRSSMTANGCTTACDWTAAYVGPRVGAIFSDLGPVGPEARRRPGRWGSPLGVTRRPGTYFLGVIGQTHWTIQAKATAVAGIPNGAPADQVLPIAVWRLPVFHTGTIYALTNGTDAPGNFGWLTWSSGGAATLAQSICSPNNGAFSFPATFRGDHGQTSSSAVRDCLQKWVDAKQPVLLPIVDSVSDDDAPQYRIVALAAFTITSFSSPTVDQINGRFEGTLPYSMGSTIPGGVGWGPSLTSPFYYIGLTQ